MKVIRAKRGIHIPRNPENPDMNAMQLVQTGLLALIPDDFQLPEDAFAEVGKFTVRKNKDESKEN